MSSAEEKFREQVANILGEEQKDSEKLFEIMELFREAQYDMLSSITVSTFE